MDLIDILGIVVPGQQLYDLENFQPSPMLPGFPGVSYRFTVDNISFSWNFDTLARHYDASSAFGETFGFYIFERSGSYITWMNLPYGYVSGTPINGGMLFAGETLYSMGLSPTESFQVFLPGQEMISGVVVVPEPQSTLLWILGMFVIVINGRAGIKAMPINTALEPAAAPLLRCGPAWPFLSASCRRAWLSLGSSGGTY